MALLATSSCRRADGYARRQPEQTTLYEVLRQHWATFLARAEQTGSGLPSFVREEVEAFLRCGLPQHGLLHLECPVCGFDMVVAWSCKKRGFCPSCIGRRMSELAAHLVDSVIPRVPLRQWTFTVPHRLRYLMAYDKELCSEVIAAFVRALYRHLRAKAKGELGLESTTRAHPGSVTFLQRSGSSINLHPHLHVPVLDGVYVVDEAGDRPSFHVLSPPTEEQLIEIIARVAHRVTKVLDARGLPANGDEAESDTLASDEPLLATCYATSVLSCDALGDRAGQPTVRLVGEPPASSHSGGDIAVHRLGFSLHVGDQIDGRDRNRVERLIRYIARPPIATDRLRMRTDGDLAYTMKTPWSDGTHSVSMSPLDFIARLCALVPPPRFHTVRYHGVLAAHAALRPLVVPGADHDETLDLDRVEELIGQLELFPLPELPSAPRLPGGMVDIKTPKGSSYIPYHELLRRVFKVDIHACPRCSGRLRIKGSISAKPDIERILEALGIPTDPPVIAPARAPPQQTLHLRHRAAPGNLITQAPGLACPPRTPFPPGPRGIPSSSIPRFLPSRRPALARADPRALCAPLHPRARALPRFAPC